MHFECDRHWIERIAIAEYDQGVGGDRGQVWRREVHVVVAVGQRADHGEELQDLRLAVLVALAHAFHFLVSDHRFRKLSLDGTRLLREIRWRAHDDHRFDGGRIRGGHVQQRDTAAAEANRLYSRNLQVTEQRLDVE